MENPSCRGAFTFFKRLPAEIRRLVWKYALPGPRVLTHSALYNSRLSLLNVCRESREVVKLSYVRLLRPRSGFDLLENPAAVLWANPEFDTIVIDLTAPQTEESGSDILSCSLFSLDDQKFMTQIFRPLIGLSRVKHLALAFNLIHDNGGALFIALQAAFPDLQTLTVFPNSQMHVSARDQHNYGVKRIFTLLTLIRISLITHSSDMTCYQKGDTRRNLSGALRSFTISTMLPGNMFRYFLNTSRDTV